MFSYFLLFFFFKQKTAYEMRISDWSSDVCSSDLNGCRKPRRHDDLREEEHMTITLRINGEPATIDAATVAALLAARGIDRNGRGTAVALQEIGRASCRVRVCQYV